MVSRRRFRQGYEGGRPGDTQWLKGVDGQIQAAKCFLWKTCCSCGQRIRIGIGTVRQSGATGKTRYGLGRQNCRCSYGVKTLQLYTRNGYGCILRGIDKRCGPRYDRREEPGANGVTPDELLLPNAEDLASGRDPVMAHAVELCGSKMTSEAAGVLFPFQWPPL